MSPRSRRSPPIGDPWASLATYGLLDDGSPVLCVSHLAEHGRNLAWDPRLSIVITEVDGPSDPLAAARVTLAGRAERPVDPALLAAARAAHLAGVPAASMYIDFSDFSVWVVRVHRVRWVGGYGRMDSASGADYTAAAPDPVSAGSAKAVTHLNDDHADALLAIARALCGHPDADSARCTGLDRRGIDLTVQTPRGRAPARVAFPTPLDEPASCGPRRSRSRAGRGRWLAATREVLGMSGPGMRRRRYPRVGRRRGSCRAALRVVGERLDQARGLRRASVAFAGLPRRRRRV